MFHVGQYHFNAKRVAFRNDYCRGCDRPVRAYKVRTLDVVNVSFVPVLPVGHGERWHCGVCGRDPHRVVKTRSSVVILALVILAPLTLLAWVVLFSERPEDRSAGWSFRFMLTAGTAGCIAFLRRGNRERSLRQMVGSITGATDTVCPVDGELLVYTTDWQCPKCGIIRQSYVPLDEIP